MSTPVIAFFNNKGGVGKTSLVYHVGWMMADQGFRVVAVDLDPQGNLSAAFLDETRLEELWPDDQRLLTVFGAIRPLKTGTGDVETPLIEPVVDNLVLVPGDMALSEFEDDLSAMWPRCLDGDERAFRVMSAFWRMMQKAAQEHDADVVLVDLGPNLGSINRAALIAADYVVVPIAPDLFSIQGLRNLGPTLVRWRKGWGDRYTKNPVADLNLPEGKMQPMGYIVMQHSVRRDRPVKSYDKWISRIPSTYAQYVLAEPRAPNVTQDVSSDPNCLALLKHYRSLIPMAQEARKPIFHLRAADGALGAQSKAVADARSDFRELATRIARGAGLAKSADAHLLRIE